MSKRKRISISLETKYKILKEIDKNTPYKQILELYKNELTDIYNISKIKKSREKIEKEYLSSTSTKAKSLKKK
jgi:hypothetical protein